MLRVSSWFLYRRLILAASGILLAMPLLRPEPARASDATPFAVINNSPLTQIRAAPAPSVAAAPGAAETRVGLSVLRSNQFVSRTTDAETLILDGETTRVTLSAARGLGDGREVAIEIPFVSHAGGGLDHSIEKFHDTFGFPDGGRPAAPRNRLLFLYQRDGSDVLRISESQDGIGDMRLSVGQQLLFGSAPGGWDAAVRGEIKFATGDAEGLLGSGGTDVATWLSAACNDAECPLAFRWYGTGGLMYLGRGDVLSSQVRRLVAFGAGGVAWLWTDTIVFKVQIDAQTAVYRDSGIKALKSPSHQLTVGASWRIAPDHALDFAFTEDISVTTAPDIGFLLAWRYGR
jgi:hypothetical protein